MTAPHVLVVDDDPELRRLLARFLSGHGFRVSGARSGAEMWVVLEGAAIDLIVLDLMLPGTDGLELCRQLRGRSKVPVIMLTARGDETDRVVGLEVGADDYVPKPFSPRELLARIKAVLRRTAPSGRTEGEPRRDVLVFAGWRLDTARRELVSPHGVVVDLTSGEYDLLLAFLERPQRVLSRDQLLEIARSRTASPFDRSIDVQVSRLRHKIDAEDDASSLIKTVRGVGYVLACQVERR